MNNNKQGEEKDKSVVNEYDIKGDGNTPDHLVVDPNAICDSESSHSINLHYKDLCAIRNKRAELDTIQKDLDSLMCSLNDFISDFPDKNGDGDEGTSSIVSVQDVICPNTEIQDGPATEIQDGPNTEKQDGPPEKDLLSLSLSSDDVYISDGLHPPEIDWTSVAPVLQKHVADLQQLQCLNRMTGAVVKRIRNLTQINEAIIKEVKHNGEENQLA